MIPTESYAQKCIAHIELRNHLIVSITIFACLLHAQATFTNSEHRIHVSNMYVFNFHMVFVLFILCVCVVSCCYLLLLYLVCCLFAVFVCHKQQNKQE